MLLGWRRNCRKWILILIVLESPEVDANVIDGIAVINMPVSSSGKIFQGNQFC